MNYIREINAFYSWLELNELSPSAISLWQALMHINNKAGWTQSFTVAESVLSVKTKLSGRAIRDAREKLVQSGRISVTTRPGGQLPIYTIKPFEASSSEVTAEATTEESAENISVDHAGERAEDTENDVSSENISAVTTAVHATLNKHKHKQENKRLKDLKEGVTDVPPLSQDVPVIQFAPFIAMTQQDYDRLTENLGEEKRDDYFYAYADWISRQSKAEQKKRKPFHTIMNWHRRDEKKKNNVTPFKPRDTRGDTSGYSPEFTAYLRELDKLSQ